MNERSRMLKANWLERDFCHFYPFVGLLRCFFVFLILWIHKGPCNFFLNNLSDLITVYFACNLNLHIVVVLRRVAIETHQSGMILAGKKRVILCKWHGGRDRKWSINSSTELLFSLMRGTQDTTTATFTTSCNKKYVFISDYVELMPHHWLAFSYCSCNKHTSWPPSSRCIC